MRAQRGTSFHPLPHPRSHLTEAAALYNLVDGQLHDLVTASNQLLQRLELRVRLGHLETAIHQVKGRLQGIWHFYRAHYVLELTYHAGRPWYLGQGRKHAFKQ